MMRHASIAARFILGIVTFFLFVQVAGAQPENFMVGTHLFTRPPGWTWMDLPPQATISAKLLLSGKTREQNADVVFVETKSAGAWASANDTIGRWQKNFIELPEKQNSQREEKKLKRAKVTFFWQEGTYKTTIGAAGIVQHPGFAQYGAIIEDGKNHVLARVLGSKEVVEDAKSAFKLMVEHALLEQD